MKYYNFKQLYEGKIDNSWYPLFSTIPEKISDKIMSIDFDNSYPPADKIFNVFKMPLHNIRVVILGQDPYPNEGVSIGIAFGVSESTRIPPSLRIIAKEVGHPIDKTLSHWIEQGVFLLNTALTVEKKKPGTHIEIWEEFTKGLIKYISVKQSPVWMLWGNYSKSYKRYILNPEVVEASHPVAEVYRSNAGFLNSKVFEKVNEILISNNKSKINW